MSKGLILLDTSVMLEILQVPEKSTPGSPIPDKFNAMLGSNEYTLYLPIATVIETGNHIAQIKRKGGKVRRIIAQEFVSKVKMAIAGTTPFKALEWEAREMADWIVSFPDCAARGESFGDLSIIEQFNRLCQQPPMEQPIRIWSGDGHLASYSRNWEEEP